MLKSLSTQFAATLFFGPVGLAYSSVAGAVLLSLIFAVLFFTEVGSMAIFIVWPVAIVTGLILVKLHNDRMTQSGSRLLLGPGEEGDLISTAGSWGRGLAVLSLMAIGGYVAFIYLPSVKDNSVGRIVDSKSTISDAVIAANEGIGTENEAETVWAVIDSEPAVLAPTSGDSVSTLVTLDEQVVIDTSSRPDEVSFVEVNSNVLYVTSKVVNLRSGPGTANSILTQVNRGDELQEIGRDNGWVNVIATNTGTDGWILGRLVNSTQQ